MKKGLVSVVAAFATASSAVASPPVEIPSRKVLIGAYPSLYKAAVKSPRIDERRDVLTHGRASNGKVVWDLVASESRRLWLAFHPKARVEIDRARIYRAITKKRPYWPENKRLVYAWWMSRGKPEADFSCLATIVDRYENGTWHVRMVYGRRVLSVDAFLTTGLAGGIPQALPPRKMASAGADWATNPVTQFRWMAGYARGRYGSSCGALGYRQGHSYY